MFLWFWLAAVGCGAAQAGVVPLLKTHSHNDYLQKRPLFDALDRGFMSVEADVHLRGQELLIGHSGGDVKPGVSLQSLYLDPLLARVRANGGRVYPGGPKGFQLLVELKSSSDPSYQALRSILRGYTEMLTVYDGDHVKEGAVTVVITGHTPDSLMKLEPLRYAAIDGSSKDIDSREKTLYPLISDRWSSVSDWTTGPLNALDRRRVAQHIARVHGRGRKVRFWAAPDHEEAWGMLLDAGVDYIHTDRLEDVKNFMHRRYPIHDFLEHLKRLLLPVRSPNFDGLRLTR